jgi:hypothetical protein
MFGCESVAAAATVDQAVASDLNDPTTESCGVPADQAQSANISRNRARGGVTRHHVRYVLAFGLAGVIFAFIVLGLLFGFGSN